jgi:hypothetical protein
MKKLGVLPVLISAGAVFVMRYRPEPVPRTKPETAEDRAAKYARTGRATTEQLLRLVTVSVL